MEEYHAEFGLFKDHESSLSFFCCECDVIVSDKLMEFIDINPNDPQYFV